MRVLSPVSRVTCRTGNRLIRGTIGHGAFRGHGTGISLRQNEDGEGKANFKVLCLDKSRKDGLKGN